MNNKESIVEAYMNILNENTELVNGNLYSVDMDIIIKEGIKHIKSLVDVDIEYIEIKDGKVVLKIAGEPNEMAIIKDRLNIEDDESLSTDTGVNKIKRNLTQFLDNNLGEQFELKFDGMSTLSSSVIIYMTLTIQSLPGNIKLFVYVYENNDMQIKVNYYGGAPDNSLSVTVRDYDSLLARINLLRSQASKPQIDDK